jgi:hypothetical protein
LPCRIFLPPLDGFTQASKDFMTLPTGRDEIPHLIYLIVFHPILLALSNVVFYLHAPYGIFYFTIKSVSVVVVVVVVVSSSTSSTSRSSSVVVVVVVVVVEVVVVVAVVVVSNKSVLVLVVLEVVLWR